MRYLPLSAEDRAEMLRAIGASSVEDLFVDVPEAVRAGAVFDLPDHQGELAIEKAFTAFAMKNLARITSYNVCYTKLLRPNQLFKVLNLIANYYNSF